MYQILILGNPFFIEELKGSLKEKDITFLDHMEEVDEKYPYLILFYGQSPDDAITKHPEVELSVKEMRLLPVVKKISDFTYVVPEEFHSINAIEIQSVESITKLYNFILNYFGLVNYTRKVFISYKRSDTQVLAIQLYDALSKNGFTPFLDSYSIESGVDFQEYLKNELSDAEIFLFLNSPNFPESKFTREELNIASKLGVGIVQLKFNNCKNSEIAKMSHIVDMGECKAKNEEYPEKEILKIVSAVENYRSQAFEQKNNFLIDELRKKQSIGVLKRLADKNIFIYKNNIGLFPLTKIPVSFDLERIEKFNITGVKNKHIIYNGLYYRRDILSHLAWLNTKCTNVKTIDVNNLV